MSCQKTPVKYQKMKFIADWLENEYTFSALCKRYQISRQCGYELINRYQLVGGLSRLSIWLLKLNILPERIEPGCPQQNPRHERMHRTLKAGIKLNTKGSIKEQQEWFDNFKKEFNEQRPHQALQLKRPIQIHQCSRR